MNSASRLSVWLCALFAVTLGAFLLSINPAAAGTQYGPSTRYSADQVAEAIRNSGLNSNLKAYAGDIGKLAMFESGGNAGIYNGTCCTGILQMNRGNLAAQGLTPSQYANMSLQEQVNAWAKLTNSAANAGPVKQLMEMQANGQTFDGKQVNGAMVLACIQLGTGNCQTMLRSGKCSGFQDSNGTDICEMAAKMGGSQGETSENPRSDQTEQEANNQPQNVATQILQNANKCWACEIVARATDLTVQVVPNVIKAVAGPVLPFLAIIFAIVTIFMIGRGFLWAGQMNWPEVFWNFARFVCFYALVSFSGFASEYVMGYGFFPAVQIGTSLGSEAAQAADRAFGRGLEAPVDCRYKEPNPAMTGEALQAAENLVLIACRVHVAAYGPVAAGAAMLTYDFPTASAAEWATAAVVSIMALFLVISSVLALAAFAMNVVEALLKLSVTLSLSPILLFFWIFRKTRYLAQNAFNTLLYAMFLMIFSGLLASVSAFVMSRLIGFGMGQPGTTPTIEAVFSWINENLANMSISGILLFATFSIAAGMMASHLLRAGADIASSLTNVRMGQMTQGVVSGVMSTATFALGTPAAGAAGLGAYAAGRSLTALGGAVGRTMTAVGGAAIGGGAGVLNGGGGAVVGNAGRIINPGQGGGAAP